MTFSLPLTVKICMYTHLNMLLVCRVSAFCVLICTTCGRAVCVGLPVCLYTTTQPSYMSLLYANIKIYITQLRFARTSFLSRHPARTISIYSPPVTSKPMYALRSALYVTFAAGQCSTPPEVSRFSLHGIHNTYRSRDAAAPPVRWPKRNTLTTWANDRRLANASKTSPRVQSDIVVFLL